MQSYTPVQNRFWSDGWVRQLNALDRYLFLYLLTNGRAELTGIYELPLDLMASESGIDEKDLRLSMLLRLEPKVYYKEGWVILRNYPNHRVSDSPKLLAGIRNDFLALPKHIQEIAKSVGYPIDTLSIPHRVSANRIEENRIDNTVANAKGLTIQKDTSDTDKPIRSSGGKKTTPAMEAVFEVFTDNPARKNWRLREIERESAKTLSETYSIEQLSRLYKLVMKHRKDPYCPQIDRPSQMLEKIPSMDRYLQTI